MMSPFMLCDLGNKRSFLKNDDIDELNKLGLFGMWKQWNNGTSNNETKNQQVFPVCRTADHRSMHESHDMAWQQKGSGNVQRK